MLHALLAALLLLSPAAGSARRPFAAESTLPWCLQLRQAAAQGWGWYAERGTAERGAHAAEAAERRPLWRRALYEAVQTVSAILSISRYAASGRGAPGSHTNPRVMRRDFVNDTDPLAVCNDGSPGVFYHRPSAPGSEGKWVIRFMGGGWCIDGATCAERAEAQPYWVSSRLCRETMAEGSPMDTVPDVLAQPRGVLSDQPDENPVFWDYNHVFVWYCSSDSHLGEKDVQWSHGSTWHFRGRRIRDAVVANLLQHQGLADATDVLITGDSAGGVAALNAAGPLRAMLQPRMPCLRRVKVLVDAGVFLDLPAYLPAPPPLDLRMRGIAQVLDGTYGAAWDPACVAAQPAGAAWRCFHAQYWPASQAVDANGTVPKLFLEYLYDLANVWILSIPVDAFGDLRHHMSAALATVGSATSVFAEACVAHEVIDGPRFAAISVDGVSFMDALAAWFYDDTVVQAIDRHKGAWPDAHCTAPGHSRQPLSEWPRLLANRRSSIV